MQKKETGAQLLTRMKKSTAGSKQQIQNLQDEINGTRLCFRILQKKPMYVLDPETYQQGP